MARPKTNLIKPEACEQPSGFEANTSGILFGPQSDSTVNITLNAGQYARLTAYTLPTGSKIDFFLEDRDPGLACANTATGATVPYAPCGGDPKILDDYNKITYIAGPGAFKLVSTAPPGVPFVKIDMFEDTGCGCSLLCAQPNKPVEPPEPCPAVSITAVATSTSEILVTVVAGGPVDLALGGQEYYDVSGSQVFGFLSQDTVYTVTAVSECGNRASATTRTQADPVIPPAPTYCPSMRLDSGNCGACQADIGFGYRDNSLRDPAATVELTDCLGGKYYIYPSAGMFGNVRAEIPYYDGGATVVGYLANNSDCAPPVNNVTVVNNAFAPVLPAPNLVALSVGEQGQVTGTLSSGATVVSNPIPISC